MNMQRSQDRIYFAKAFSFMEVLVSLVIISLISALLYFSYAVSLKSIAKSRQKTSDELTLLRTDSLLRSKIEGFRFPFWTKEIKFEFTGNSIEIYHDGEKTENSSVLITVPEEIKITDCTALTGEDKSIRGLNIKYMIKETEHESKILFASRIYGENKI